jgi:hypothetical protein
MLFDAVCTDRLLGRPALFSDEPRSFARILDLDRIRGMYRLGVSPDSRSAWRTRRSSARIAINSRRRSWLVIVRILKVRSRRFDIYYVSSNIEI